MDKLNFRPGGPLTFHHPIAFWAGTAAVIFGVGAHMPMFFQARHVHFHMAGMSMSPLMMAGMYAVVLGTILAGYGLYPAGSVLGSKNVRRYQNVQVRAMDDARLGPAHWKVISALVIALIVDVMKPATLGFVMPGTAAEYGLSRSQVAALPVAGITGTVLGSFLWGYLADTIGRRPSILLAAIVFIGTAICGAMPSFGWNVFMCFMMGLGAGGMLPIAFALLAEIVPAKQRGWLVVLIAGLATVGGYLAASGSAALLETQFSWRILWFLGGPTGLILIALNRFIPESPRYLLMRGENDEARRIMETFGERVVRQDSTSMLSGSATSEDDLKPAVSERLRPGGLSQLFRPPYRFLSLGLGLYGLAWGLANFGFLLWLPINLRSLGMEAGASDAILAKSAILAFPATVLAAWLYHRWSTRKTMVLFALLTATTLAGFAVVGSNLAGHSALLSILVVALLVSSSGVISMLSPYTAEVYPIHIRGIGSGWTAASSKLGGVIVLVAAFAGLVPGIAAAAIVVAIPTVLSALMLTAGGIETRGRSLEEIQAWQAQTRSSSS